MELLETIALNTEPIDSFQIVVTDNKTRFTMRFNPHIQLKTKKVTRSLWFTWKLIIVFLTSPPKTTILAIRQMQEKFGIILVPEGSYDIEDINKFIQQKMKQNKTDMLPT